jgi:hypothetical protein
VPKLRIRGEAARAPSVAGVDEGDLAAALGALAVGEYPDVGEDAGVVEHLVRRATMASSRSFSMIQRRISDSPPPALPANRGLPENTIPR